MITRTTRACFVAASLCLLSGLVVAADLPRQGATMDDVRKQFGAPASDLGAVGTPAITRWVYDGFTVYFEGRRVIQTVQTQPLYGSAPAASTPAPAPRPATPPPPAPPPPQPVAVPAPAAPKPFQPAPAPAVAAPAPVVEAPVVVAPPPAAAPVAPVVETPAPKSPSSAFRFDPATGRLVIDGDESTQDNAEPEQEPAPAAKTSPAPSAAAEQLPKGEPRVVPAPPPPQEEELVFDPETGTFRAR